MTKESDLFNHDFTQVNQVLKSKTIMTNEEKLYLLSAIGMVGKAKAITSVLCESMTNENVISNHQRVVVEMIEDILIDAIAIFDKVAKPDL